MFEVTMGKGFQITFKNGNTLSVQFGKMSYCEARDLEGDMSVQEVDAKSTTAEVAAWAGEVWLHFGERQEDMQSDVNGWCTPEYVAKLAVWVAENPITESSVYPEEDKESKEVWAKRMGFIMEEGAK